MRARILQLTGAALSVLMPWLAMGCTDIQKEAEDFCTSHQNQAEDHQACVARVTAALIERQRVLTEGTHPNGHGSN